MCGIVGACGGHLAQMKKNSGTIFVQNMLSTILHRGPDGNKICFSKDMYAMLGMATLSIVPAQNGLGPFTTKDDCIYIAYNGEVYNYQEVANHIHLDLNNQNDTEVILAAYKKMGIGFVKHIEGMFAIAIYDARLQKLYLVRDRMGQKPLYYSITDKLFLFGSEIKALLLTVQSSPLIKESFQTFENTIHDETLYEHIYLLPPATILTYDVATHGFHRQKYWRLEASSNPTTGLIKDDLDTFSKLLYEAVSLAKPTEPFGLLLSGGLDSSILAYMMKPQYVLTTRFSNLSRYDETENAQTISRGIDANHIWIEPTSSDFQENIFSILHHLDRPVGNASILPEYLAYKSMKGLGLRVSVSGVGVDELMLGYTRHLLMYYQPHHLPQSIRKAYNPLIKLFEKRTSPDMHNSLRYYQLIRRGKHNPEMQEYVINAFTKGGTLSQSITHVDLNINFPSLLLSSDHLSSAFGIENRSPYLYTPLVEFMYWLNDSQKITSTYTKSLLRQFAQNIGIPTQIYASQEKIGFSMPMNLLMAGNGQILTNSSSNTSHCSPSAIEERGVYDRHQFITTLLYIWKTQSHLTSAS
jgi:asparagine synthase (glutamine-hydrolysing)